MADPTPSTATASSPGASPTLVSKMRSDMNFVGIFTIIYGALNCLSIVGLIFGIPLVIAGLRIREAADAFGAYRQHGNANLLQRAFEKQRTYFFIQKILIIVGLVLALLTTMAVIALLVGIFSLGALPEGGGAGASL